jgi:hypothetical protein
LDESVKWIVYKLDYCLLWNASDPPCQKQDHRCLLWFRLEFMVVPNFGVHTEHWAV